MLPSLLSLARSRRLSHSIRAGRATTPRGEDRRIDIETFDFETFEVRALWSSRMTDVEIVLCVVFTCVSHNSHTQSVCTVYHIKHAFHTRLDTYNFVIADAGSHVLNGATPRRAAGEESRRYQVLTLAPGARRGAASRSQGRARSPHRSPPAGHRPAQPRPGLGSGGSTRRRWRRCRR